jgi:hypothetical protein
MCTVDVGRPEDKVRFFEMAYHLSVPDRVVTMPPGANEASLEAMNP